MGSASSGNGAVRGEVGRVQRRAVGGRVGKKGVYRGKFIKLLHIPLPLPSGERGRG